MATDESMLEGRGVGYKFLGTWCFKLVYAENKMLPGLMAQACNPKAGESGQWNETVSQNKVKICQGTKCGSTHQSVTPVLERYRQEVQKFKVILDYMVSLKPA